MWIAVTGGFLEKQKQIFDGMENYRGVYVSQPDITMIIELGKHKHISTCT